jgi:hypothetical protein
LPRWQPGLPLMTDSAQLARSVLWCAHPILQAIVAGVMYRRKLQKIFPAFFGYMIAQIAIFAIVFPLQESGDYTAYFYAYWATNALSVVLGFKVIHEIFLDVFRPYHTLRDLGTVLFRWAGLVMLMVAAVVAASTAGGNTDPFVNAILTLERSIRVVQVGLVLFLLVFSRYLGISWKQKSFGIALGFGGFAGVELALIAMNWWGQNVHHQATSALVNLAAYDAAILIWIGYVVAKSPERSLAINSSQTRRWEESLTEIQYPSQPDSLIPMFEGMVDRALSRTPERAVGISEVLAQTDGILNRQAAAASASSHYQTGPLSSHGSSSKS